MSSTQAPTETDVLTKVVQYAQAVPLHDATEKTNIAFQCYDKNPEVGGTWFENRYPGCACDIPSVNYQFSWHPKPDWSRYYSEAEEILEYFKDVVNVHGLGRYVKLNHWVEGAYWDDKRGKWKLEIRADDEAGVGRTIFDEGDVLINATGVLNNWKWPAVPGLDKFKNKLHSANWDSTIDLEDKVVGIIGNGSSAVQIIPAIFPKVAKIKSFMRSPTWITAGFAQKYAGENGANFEYSEEQKQTFRDDPAAYLHYRKTVEQELNQRFKFIINGSEHQKEALGFARSEMARKLNGREDLISKLVPTDFAVGCRRPTPGNGYLECIADEEKCSVTFDAIKEATETGLITADGTHHDIDVLVCATGFDVSFKPKFPIVGKGGLQLKDAWAEQPNTYLSATIPQFPNYFMINGPFGPYGHGSILPIIEIITRYIEKFIAKLGRENIKSFYPKQEATDEFKRHREHFLLRTAWSSPCRSWFKGGTVDGPIMMWPGSRLHFFEALAEPRYEDYEWEYQLNNRFSYFGNGFSLREVDGGDTTWYIDGV
ncbi:flavin-containing monooxygenase [Aspergillus undulatus]|uniref:flavin-containing monooxygenase n=1 Tax=Aspergillus undulatus TaxID=1810928 RepID=UPI003CCE2C96